MSGKSMTVIKGRKPHDGPICGASKRQGAGVCTQAPGWGTAHPGQGRCKLHGGATPARHGRYSSIQRAEIRDLYEKHAADPEPLNLLHEVAMLRAFLEDFVNRYDEWRDAILAWWQSWSLARRPWTVGQVEAIRSIVDDYDEAVRSRSDLTDRQEEGLALARELLDCLAESGNEGRPRQILDVSAAHQMLGEIGKMVERIEKIRAANAISRADLLRVMTEMGRVVEAHVKDETARERITEGWLGIRVA